jgi:seryl-tRNA synthetase
MLDTRFIRENPEIVKKAILDKGEKVDLDQFLKMDLEWRNLLKEGDILKQERNTVTQDIAQLKKAGKNADEKISKMRGVSDRIKNIDQRIKDLEEKRDEILMWVPNVPHSSVPPGDETNTKVIREWGVKREFDFEPLPHWDLGESLGILDFKGAAKVAGAHFINYKGLGALLERGLINFMLNLHIQKHGYTEVLPPYLINRTSMFGTGQLPKLEEDMYHLEVDDLFLDPTAECPVTNLHREEILKEENLPIRYTAYTTCFRREAGSYGKETKGLLRVHQFNKVELVQFTQPEKSQETLEEILKNAEEVLQLLNLPYRVVLLPTQEMSFASHMTYDIEIWAPGVKKYLEVSSVSNFTDFQARRANIRFRSSNQTEFVHTLNGSGLATPRTYAALLETYQEKDGSIVIPEVLRDFMGGVEKIE